MNAFRMGTVIVLTMLPAMVGFGQTATQDQIRKLSTDEAVEVAEDMEIFAELLYRQIGGLYAHASDLSVHQAEDRVGAHHMFAATDCAACHKTSSLMQREHMPSRPLGSYLPEYGVVYQLRAPGLPRAGNQPSAGERKEASAWQRARGWLEAAAPQEAQGERPRVSRTFEDESRWKQYLTLDALGMPSRQEPTQEELVGKLLELLAENGRHFRHLGEGDRVTIATTFRGFGEPSKNVRHGWLSPVVDKADMEVVTGRLLSKMPVAFPEGSQTGTAEGYEMRGDLHMRQDNPQEAVKAYEKALKDAAVLVSVNNELMLHVKAYQGRTLTDQHRRLLRKLAQAMIAANDVEPAIRLLQRLAPWHSSGTSGDTTPSAQAVPLPAKLVVSVRKADCDAVAAGEITGEEFRARARVDYFDPTSANE